MQTRLNGTNQDRPHSSQRNTSSSATAAENARSSAALTSSWQPVQRRARSSAAPTLHGWCRFCRREPAIRWNQRRDLSSLLARVAHFSLECSKLPIAVSDGLPKVCVDPRRP